MVIALVAGTAIDRGNDYDSAGADAVSPLASDSFSRTVGAGLGSADVGGRWVSRTNASAFTPKIDGRAASLPVAAGTYAEVWLPAVSGDDIDMRLKFTVPSVPSVGSGVYLGVDLRKQANGDTLRARVRIGADRVAHLGFTRVRNDVEVRVGSTRTVAGKVIVGRSMVLEGRVSGSSTVSLASRLYSSAVRAPAWQATAADSGAARISARGSVGVWSYVTRQAPKPVTMSLDALDAYEVNDDGSGPTHPPIGSRTPSTPPATNPPTTRVPSTPVTTKPPSSSTKPTTTTPTASPTTTPPDPGPGDPGDAGSLAPGKSSYPVPSGAVFVSPSGSDSGRGDRSSPWRTVAHAIAKAKSGATIVLRGGTYHESVKLPAGKTLTLQSYPREAVWFDGTSAVSGWRDAGDAWVHDGWTASFDHSPSFIRGRNSGFVNSAHPMAAHPDQAWVGGKRLDQVGSVGAVRAGTFYVDEGANRLYVGTDPKSGVRASTLEMAIDVRSSGSRLRGFGVRGYATPAPDLGSVRLGGKGAVAENLVVTTSATVGLAALITDLTVRHVTLTDNGLLGMLGNQVDRLVATGIRAERNNSEQFNTAPVAGGVKITRSRHITVDGGVFRANLATGLWIDESCYDVTITRNTMTDNLKHGISWEIGALGLIADNVVTGNTRDGMKINNVAHVRIWNNTVSENAYEIVVAQDSRRASNLSTPGHDPRQPKPDPTVTWVVSDIDIHNNLVSEPERYSVWVRDASGERSAGQMGVAVDGNVFGTAAPKYPFLWGRAGGTPQVFSTVAAFESGAPGVGERNGATMSSATPLALPADAARAIGQPAGTKHVGAF